MYGTDRKYNDYKEIIDQHILDCLPEIDQKSITLYDAMKYSLTAGGKRLRPVLLLAACDFCGGDIKMALPYALAIEYIHTYSLIHDDLPAMDDDDFRRGIPTNHKVYGEAIAILAGDGLLSSAFEAMNKDMLLYFDDAGCLKCRVKASYEIAKGAGCRGMIAGQVSDIELASKNVSNELLEYIHVNKTAALIVAAIRAGAHLGKADDSTLRLLTDYAECLGLAFQICDDMLDADNNKDKSNYVVANGIEKSKNRVKELTDFALQIMAPHYDNAEFFNKLAGNLAVQAK